MSDVDTAIDALKISNAAGFRDATSAALYDRVAQTLQAKKVEIAQNVFADSDTNQDMEETENADSDTDS